VADRSIVVRLRAEIADFKSKMDDAAASTKKAAAGASEFVTKNEQSINTLSNQIGLVGAGLTGFAALAVAKFADFDQAMSGVEATGDDARENLVALRQAAIDAGASTVYSATEAANAIEEMAKAGVSAKDILGGGLTGALDLAAAGELEVADAAAIASTTMNQFGLTGKDVSHIADVLAASAGKANGEVADFGLAMKYVGPVASQLGVSLEETSGTLALLAENGLLADSAGTGLRGVMMSLTAPTKAAQQTMDEYNISAFDAQGNFVGLASLAGQLKTQLGGLTEAERSAALGRMFGNEQITTARILYDQGADAIRKWTSEVDDQGYAAEVAATKLDNLIGDWEGFTGALDTAFISMGEGANGPLRELVQAGTNLVDAFNELPGPVQQATLLVVGGAGLVALGVAGMGKLAIAVNETKTAMAALGITAKGAGLAAGALGLALGAAAVGLTVWAENAAAAKARTEEYLGTLDELGNRTDTTVKRINDALSENQNSWFRDMFQDAESLIDRADKAGIAIEDLQGYILGNEDAIKRVTAASREYVASGMEYATQSDINAAAARFLTDALDTESDALTEAEKKAAQKTLANEAAGVSEDALTDAVGATTEAYTEQVDKIGDLIDARNELAGVVLTEREAQREYEAALDGVTEALERSAGVTDEMRDAQGNLTAAGQALVEQYVASGQALDITTEKGRANQAALDEIVNANGRVVKAMYENGATQEQIQAQVQRSRDDFLRMAESLGISAGDAQALADKLDLIPGNYTAQVFADTDPALAAIETFVRIASQKTITIQARVDADPSYNPASSPYSIRRAGGGEVPSNLGTPGRDSVPALLMPDEHVWTTAEVRAAGGHEAMYRLRSAVLRGDLVGLAAGGPPRARFMDDVAAARTDQLRAAVAVANPAGAAPQGVRVTKNYPTTVVSRERVRARDVVDALRITDMLDPES
jgi:TP901 family phage tail tape measure protein